MIADFGGYLTDADQSAAKESGSLFKAQTLYIFAHAYALFSGKKSRKALIANIKRGRKL